MYYCLKCFFVNFIGTDVIQTRYYKSQKVLAVVVNTAFWTAKGGLVRSILFPKPLNVKLWKDSIKFVMALAVLGAFGVAYSLTVNLVHQVSMRVVVCIYLVLVDICYALFSMKSARLSSVHWMSLPSWYHLPFQQHSQLVQFMLLQG